MKYFTTMGGTSLALSLLLLGTPWPRPVRGQEPAAPVTVTQKLPEADASKRDVEQFLQDTRFPVCWGTLERWQQTPLAERLALLEELSQHLKGTLKRPMTEMAGAVIVSRLDSGEMRFDGHGLILWQDVWIEGGKAAWAIMELLRIDYLPAIVERMPDGERGRAARAASEAVRAYKNGVEDATAAAAEEARIQSERLPAYPPRDGSGLPTPPPRHTRPTTRG